MLAPHPDDETLGTGGLVAALAAAKAEVTVAILTDGAASHVGAPGWTPTRLAGLRRAEAGAALRTLGHRDPAVALGWRDASPHVPGTSAWDATVRRLVALCRRRRIACVAASWGGDPHCDHEAAARLAAAVARRIGARLFFFAVWGWTRPDLDRRLAAVRARAISVARHRGQTRRALACHRSQLGGRVHGAHERFVLPRPMRRLADLPFTLLLEPHHAA